LNDYVIESRLGEEKSDTQTRRPVSRTPWWTEPGFEVAVHADILRQITTCERRASSSRVKCLHAAAS
jgi:hypothetical protein